MLTAADYSDIRQGYKSVGIPEVPLDQPPPSLPEITTPPAIFIDRLHLLNGRPASSTPGTVDDIASPEFFVKYREWGARSPLLYEYISCRYSSAAAESIFVFLEETSRANVMERLQELVLNGLSIKEAEFLLLLVRTQDLIDLYLNVK